MTEWISVFDQTPTEELPVLVYVDKEDKDIPIRCRTQYVTLGFVSTDKEGECWTVVSRTGAFEKQPVLYWMPLPEPPVEE